MPLPLALALCTYCVHYCTLSSGSERGRGAVPQRKLLVGMQLGLPSETLAEDRERQPGAWSNSPLSHTAEPWRPFLATILMVHCRFLNSRQAKANKATPLSAPLTTVSPRRRATDVWSPLFPRKRIHLDEEQSSLRRAVCFLFPSLIEALLAERSTGRVLEFDPFAHHPKGSIGSFLHRCKSMLISFFSTFPPCGFPYFPRLTQYFFVCSHICWSENLPIVEGKKQGNSKSLPSFSLTILVLSPPPRQNLSLSALGAYPDCPFQSFLASKCSSLNFALGSGPILRMPCLSLDSPFRDVA